MNADHDARKSQTTNARALRSWTSSPLSATDDQYHESDSGEMPPSSWQAIVNALPDATVVLNAQKSVLHHNQKLSELFPNARTGQSISQLSRNPDLRTAIEAAASSGKTRVVILLQRVPVERRISATVSQLASPSTEASSPSFLVTFRDLSEQDKLEQMRADFIANASHELRTPLASLRGYIDTLQGAARDDADARLRFLEIMATQAGRMTRLIDDLLSLSRVEMRAHLKPNGVVDLNEVVAEVAQALAPIAQETSAQISVAQLDSKARIRGEREEIVQLVQNFVLNAIRYGRPNGNIRVVITAPEARQGERPKLALAVCDDGPGIAKNHLPRLTERFYRASKAASREKGGTGLGLAIAKHIALRHGGDLQISSELGRGSTFTVVFDRL